MSSEERLIERLRESSPGAVALAEVVSFAVLVEPQLLRRARLELLEGVDVGAEADLWLSRVVQSRGPEGVVLLPRAAELLRLSLADRPELLERAWQLTSEMHAHLPVTLRFEEEINRLSVRPDDRALARIESLLRSIAGTLVQDEERRGLANWAARALPRLPAAIRRLEPARVLAMASYLRLGAALPVEASPPEEELPEWVAWALPKDLPPSRLGARLVAGGVEFGPPPDDDKQVINLPATDPLLVEMSWTESGQRRVRQVSLRQGERRRFDAPFTEITLRTLLGDRYTITPIPDAEGEEAQVMQQNRPQCYVAMPFGRKRDQQTGREINFDIIYDGLIGPGVERAGFMPVRLDEVPGGGLLIRDLFEKLIFSEAVIVDLTTHNANILYELGIRHAVRPARTILISGWGHAVPFDLNQTRVLSYNLNEDGAPGDVQTFHETLARLLEPGSVKVDSPVFQLVEGYTAPQVAGRDGDASGERERRANELKQMVAEARRQGSHAVREAEQRLGDLETQDAGVITELVFAYAAVGTWADVLSLVERLPAHLAETVPVRQQYALALRRAGKSGEAEKILLQLLQTHGPSSETYGLLGGVYKSHWQNTPHGKSARHESKLLDQAIDTYLRGFETDWRDPYPGIHAATLLEFKTPPQPRQDEILPVIRYAVSRRIASGNPAYWDFATLLLLSVITGDQDEAKRAMQRLRGLTLEGWQLNSTIHDLQLLIEAKGRHKKDVSWVQSIEKELDIWLEEPTTRMPGRRPA